MGRDALIIEHASTPFPVPWQTGPELVDYRRSDWVSFLQDHSQFHNEVLLIANAVPRSDEVTKFFRWLCEHPIRVPILAILPAQDTELLQLAAEAVDDFLLTPLNEEEFRRRVLRLLGPPPRSIEGVLASLTGELGLNQMVGSDVAFQQVIVRATAFAASEAPVLLTGETGTGKELCARVVHLLSKRQHGPFIPVECGALPEHLFENELFGHCRGAFTDAYSDQKGLVALAHSGTLFLDEVDGLSLSLQAKILRLVQEKTYRPLGSEHFQKSNVRIISATNSQLEWLVSEKKFREDLFFRLNVLRVHLPALRERRADIALLARYFVEEICRTSDLSVKVLSPAAIRKLEGHAWPGNVRELYNTLQRAVLCTPGTQIASAQIDFCTFAAVGEDSLADFRGAKLQAIQKFEREYVRNVLDQYEGNITRAARAAGKDRRAFGRLAKKYGFPQRAS